MTIEMDRVIDKELISQLLKLETNQQENVLAYIKELLESDEMNNRANASEQAIKEGRIMNFDQFNEDFEQWKMRKRASVK